MTGLAGGIITIITFLVVSLLRRAQVADWACLGLGAAQEPGAVGRGGGLAKFACGSAGPAPRAPDAPRSSRTEESHHGDADK